MLSRHRKARRGLRRWSRCGGSLSAPGADRYAERAAAGIVRLAGARSFSAWRKGSSSDACAIGAERVIAHFASALL